MLARFAAVFSIVALAAGGAWAQDRSTIGMGRLAVNDALGDNNDRWRTGSLAFSVVRGPDWGGTLPAGIGQIIEYRFLGEIRAPRFLSSRAPDRPFAGSLSFGAHTHFQRGGLEISLGGDLVVIGPQTGLDDFQEWIHEGLDLPLISDAARAGQIANQVVPTAVLEIGRDVALGPRTTLRPFAEARAGDETLVRVGADLRVGLVGQGELLIRDPVTGFRYRAVKAPQPGWSFLLGGDVARVFHSVYLPESRGLTLTDTRNRLRAGLHWQGQRNAVFYGLTWLGREFESQASSQLVGAIRLDFKF